MARYSTHDYGISSGDNDEQSQFLANVTVLRERGSRLMESVLNLVRCLDNMENSDNDEYSIGTPICDSSIDLDDPVLDVLAAPQDVSPVSVQVQTDQIQEQTPETPRAFEEEQHSNDEPEVGLQKVQPVVVPRKKKAPSREKLLATVVPEPMAPASMQKEKQQHRQQPRPRRQRKQSLSIGKALAEADSQMYRACTLEAHEYASDLYRRSTELRRQIEEEEQKRRDLLEYARELRERKRHLEESIAAKEKAMAQDEAEASWLERRCIMVSEHNAEMRELCREPPSPATLASVDRAQYELQQIAEILSTPQGRDVQVSNEQQTQVSPFHPIQPSDPSLPTPTARPPTINDVSAPLSPPILIPAVYVAPVSMSQPSLTPTLQLSQTDCSNEPLDRLIALAVSNGPELFTSYPQESFTRAFLTALRTRLELRRPEALDVSSASLIESIIHFLQCFSEVDSSRTTDGVARLTVVTGEVVRCVSVIRAAAQNSPDSSHLFLDQSPLAALQFATRSLIIAVQFTARHGSGPLMSNILASILTAISGCLLCLSAIQAASEEHLPGLVSLLNLVFTLIHITLTSFNQTRVSALDSLSICITRLFGNGSLCRDHAQQAVRGPLNNNARALFASFPRQEYGIEAECGGDSYALPNVCTELVMPLLS